VIHDGHEWAAQPAQQDANRQHRIDKFVAEEFLYQSRPDLFHVTDWRTGVEISKNRTIDQGSPLLHPVNGTPVMVYRGVFSGTCGYVVYADDRRVIFRQKVQSGGPGGSQDGCRVSHWFM
jgi:hypothetical protein